MVSRYIQPTVWEYLRKHPGSKVKDVAQGLGWGNRNISSVLLIMKRNGSLRNEGKTHRSVWFIAGPKPVSQSGLSVNSQRNLLHPPEKQREHLRLAFIAKGLDPDKLQPMRPSRNPRRHYTGTLEECWPVSRAQNNNTSC